MSEYREDIIEKLEDQFHNYPEVRKGLIFGHPGFNLGGRIFCFAYEDGLSLKLQRKDYGAILELDEAEPFRPGKSPMGTWAVLTYPDAEEYIENWHWIEKSMAYIITDEAAPPKKRRRKRK